MVSAPNPSVEGACPERSRRVGGPRSAALCLLPSAYCLVPSVLCALFSPIAHPSEKPTKTEARLEPGALWCDSPPARGAGRRRRGNRTPPTIAHKTKCPIATVRDMVRFAARRGAGRRVHGKPRPSHPPAHRRFGTSCRPDSPQLIPRKAHKIRRARWVRQVERVFWRKPSRTYHFSPLAVRCRLSIGREPC